MTRYIWMIHNADEEAVLGDIYLSLHGLSAATKELKLPMRDSDRDTIESGIVEVSGDLGELQTGLLRAESAETSSWSPDWVKIINLSDGRQWTAQGGVCDSDGACPLLRFERSSDPLEIQQSSWESATDKERSKQQWSEGRPSESPAMVVRTYEIFGKLKGRVVPLAEILQIRAGVKHLTPGGQIFLTDQDSQGFGLGGEPGMWGDLYPGVNPAIYGLDPDGPVLASDGSRGRVVDAHYLAMIFGADWRRVVYGK